MINCVYRLGNFRQQFNHGNDFQYIKRYIKITYIYAYNKIIFRHVAYPASDGNREHIARYLQSHNCSLIRNKIINTQFISFLE